MARHPRAELKPCLPPKGPTSALEAVVMGAPLFSGVSLRAQSQFSWELAVYVVQGRLTADSVTISLALPFGTPVDQDRPF